MAKFCFFQLLIFLIEAFICKAQRMASKNPDTHWPEASAYAAFGHEGLLVVHLQHASTSSQAERGIQHHLLSLSIG